MSTDGGAVGPPDENEGTLPAVYDPSNGVVHAPGPVADRPVRRRPDWLVGQLPVGMLDDNFFYRFVSIFQEEAGTYLDDIDNFPNIIDPAVAPPAMVRFMAGWLALPPINPALDETYQRRLVLQASKLQWWRGTKLGLSGLLELLTGEPVEVIDSGGVFRQGEAGPSRPQAEVRVRRVGWLSEPALVDLVLDEVPANVDIQLFVGDRRIFPTGPAHPAPPPAPPVEPTLKGNDDARLSGAEAR
jgi:phage tail-like protein